MWRMIWNLKAKHAFIIMKCLYNSSLYESFEEIKCVLISFAMSNRPWEYQRAFWMKRVLLILVLRMFSED
jgi:hypothetical protein